MADGKVMQKYIPPDFDPEALKKNKDILRSLQRSSGLKKRRRGGRMMDMRMMFPFTLCCESCKDFVYVGTKFNSKVERLRGMDYLTIPLWRFYGRCPHCRHQIVFRTDPKNTDYILESGGSRTYDPNRDAGLATEALREAQNQEIQEDAVKALEVKSYSTAEELKSMAALDELRRLNRQFLGRHEDVSEHALVKLQERHAEDEEELDKDELEAARQHFLNREWEAHGDSDSFSSDDECASGNETDDKRVGITPPAEGRNSVKPPHPEVHAISSGIGCFNDYLSSSDNSDDSEHEGNTTKIRIIERREDKLVESKSSDR
eukprot:Gregarina_sp_Poly_1__10059@NODE_678_length_6812_cov_99_742476_g511_i0_p3_GENE_NODE_678_length_6812_cov_99_742476_g511_i0NODE_678_length_6812_cov_99_742476_g511_i0_p3_ORF_typecomplete_len318_score51_52DUF572/PF04502_13/1_6e53EURL/PF06937_11/0_0062zfLITAFlike/PF10601_9/1_5e02zfLITAFlike/PF10601_9/1_1_NODE_678_length_6812_cov_99_742476_g511_i03561309